MHETFEEYMDRVSRARHLREMAYSPYHYMLGYGDALKKAQNLVSEEKVAGAMNRVGNYMRRRSLKEKTAALIIEDRVLTYREDEL